MHCLWRASLLVSAATRRTIASGKYRQAPSAATKNSPHFRYSRNAATRGPPFRSETELENIATPQLSPPGPELRRLPLSLLELNLAQVPLMRDGTATQYRHVPAIR